MSLPSHHRPDVSGLPFQASRPASDMGRKYPGPRCKKRSVGVADRRDLDWSWARYAGMSRVLRVVISRAAAHVTFRHGRVERSGRNTRNAGKAERRQDVPCPVPVDPLSAGSVHSTTRVCGLGGGSCHDLHRFGGSGMYL